MYLNYLLLVGQINPLCCNGKLASSTGSEADSGLRICKSVKSFQHNVLYYPVL